MLENALTRIFKVIPKAEEKSSILSELTQLTIDNLQIKLGAEIPEELTFIVVEVTIARYNRLGSEGASTVRIDAISYSYDELFEPYSAIIKRYSKQSIKNFARLI